MNSCAVCTRHHPTADDVCTDACRHVKPHVGNLCRGCHLDLTRDLRTLAGAWDLLAGGTVASGEATSTETALPGGADWLDWRRGLAGTLEPLQSWARVWHEDLSEAIPGLVWPVQRVPDVLTWLVRLLPTAADHEAIADFQIDISHLAHHARRLCGVEEPGTVVACPGAGIEPCGRRLRVNLDPPDTRVDCRRCGSVWTASHLVYVAAHTDVDVWLCAEDISHLIGTPERTLRRWAASGKIRRQHGLYALTDTRTAAGA